MSPSIRAGLKTAIASFNPAINFVNEDRARALRECISPDPLTRSRRKLLICKAREERSIFFSKKMDFEKLYVLLVKTTKNRKKSIFLQKSAVLFF